jgi:hypothetical protein
MHETRFLLPNVEIESQALPKVVTTVCTQERTVTGG